MIKRGLVISMVLLFWGCQKSTKYPQGSFRYDWQFVSQYKNTIILSRDSARVLLVPDYQGRVLTSTTNGLEGASLGWVNHNYIAKDTIQQGGNPFGGEDRLWLGPLAGQYTLYFPKETPIADEYWHIPKWIDAEPFDLVDHSETEATFQKSFPIENHFGTQFEVQIDRKIRLLSSQEIAQKLDFSFPASIQMVGFESINTLTNKGSDWDKANGLLSLWSLGMFPGADSTWVIIPFKENKENPIQVNEYLFEADSSRLRVGEQVVLFKADGKKRSKIGVMPSNAYPIFGSYDASIKVLTIVQFSMGRDTSYFNNHEVPFQENPYKGDVINSYNNNPQMDGSASFYELESSAPAKELRQGESISHTHRTFHFVGEEKQLNKISKALLNYSLTF